MQSCISIKSKGNLLQEALEIKGRPTVVHMHKISEHVLNSYVQQAYVEKKEYNPIASLKKKTEETYLYSTHTFQFAVII